jgi:hypothetical protein
MSMSRASDLAANTKPHSHSLQVSLSDQRLKLGPRRPLDREGLHFAGDRRTTQLTHDSLGSPQPPTYE